MEQNEFERNQSQSDGMSMMGQAVEGSIEMTVIRADGSVEPLGIVSYYHKNPYKQGKWELENHGKLSEDSRNRIIEDIKKRTPVLAGSLMSLGVLAYLALKKG